MSFIQRNETVGRPYAPGWFLADPENCVRLTAQALATKGTTASDGTKYIPMGTVYPSNDNKAEGIIYEDVDVTTGDMPCSLVVKGIVLEDRLPVSIDSDAKTALVAKGFVFIEGGEE